MEITFTPTDPASIGVEWELGLVDAATGQLVPAAPKLLEAVENPEKGAIRREYLTCMVELVSGVHHRVADAMGDLAEKLTQLRGLLGQTTVPLGAGSHPFSIAMEQTHFDAERYRVVADENGWWARQLVTMGTHVHVGVDHQRKALPITSGLALMAPYFIALAGSSPFWQGTDTSFASNRTMLFQQLHTNGLPVEMDTWEEFERYVIGLESVGMISQLSEIRWDVRPSSFGTVENRLSDSVPTLWELGAITALTQCAAAWLSAELDHGRRPPRLPPWYLQENKWRAARYGVEAHVITSDLPPRVVPLRERLEFWLDRFAPHAQRLGCDTELARCATLAEQGPCYARQRREFQRSGDLRTVVTQLVAETGLEAASSLHL